MPIFHVVIADQAVEPADEGVFLDESADLRREAILFAASMIRDDPALLDEGRDFRVRLTDEALQDIFELRVQAIERRIAPDLPAVPFGLTGTSFT